MEPTSKSRQKTSRCRTDSLELLLHSDKFDSSREHVVLIEINTHKYIDEALSGGCFLGELSTLLPKFLMVLTRKSVCFFVSSESERRAILGSRVMSCKYGVLKFLPYRVIFYEVRQKCSNNLICCFVSFINFGFNIDRNPCPCPSIEYCLYGWFLQNNSLRALW